jgi:4-amino-4-deoxy-L-arabinose transferase-like glycosyltransferase
MDRLSRWLKRLGIGGGIVLALLYVLFWAYTLPSTAKVRVTGTEVVRRDVERPDGTTGIEDVNYITAEDVSGEARIFRNADTGWGWPPYFKFDSGNLLAQANNFAAEDPPPIVLVRYYGFRIPLFSMVPNAVSMRALKPGEDPLPFFNLAFGIAHAALVVWLVLRIRRWRRTASENAST